MINNCMGPFIRPDARSLNPFIQTGIQPGARNTEHLLAAAAPTTRHGDQWPERLRFSGDPPRHVRMPGFSKTWSPLQKLKSILQGSDKLSTPLHEKASKDLKRLSEQQYRVACNPLENYCFIGNSNDYYMTPARLSNWEPEAKLKIRKAMLSLGKVINELASRQPTGELQVLDIGCGTGQVIRALNQPGRVKAYGVTAEGFPLLPSLPPEQYVRGNVQNLLKILPGRENTFDVICSDLTFTHLADPLGVLTQAYQLLKPGGVLLVDGFHIPGLENHLQDINQYLQNQGFEACFLREPVRQPFYPVGPVMIRKTAERPILDLPVKYDCIRDERQKYKPDLKKLKPNPHIRPESLDEMLNHFTTFRRGIGLTDACLRYDQDPMTQRQLHQFMEQERAATASSS